MFEVVYEVVTLSRCGEFGQPIVDLMTNKMEGDVSDSVQCRTFFSHLINFNIACDISVGRYFFDDYLLPTLYAFSRASLALISIHNVQANPSKF